MGPRYYFGKLKDPLEGLVPCSTGAPPFRATSSMARPGVLPCLYRLSVGFKSAIVVRVRRIRCRKKEAAMPVSDDFTKLKEQVDAADRHIKTAVAQDDAELKAMVDDARKKADARAAQLRDKTNEVAEQADRNWNQVQSDWDKHVQRIRERIDAKKAAADARAAEGDAEWAEADAFDAVGFAEAAIEEAEYATLDAVMARRKADVMAAAN